MASHCMTSRYGVLSLLGLCKKDCYINMLNFNKLRFIVYEILDNSQLFSTDPRNSCIALSTWTTFTSKHGMINIAGVIPIQNHCG